jgi:serine protease DegQ
MGVAGPTRPRVSRETRLLLVTILISIAALWALARIRFPERPASTNPVPPLLTQLASPPGFDDLASEVSTLDSRVLPSLAQVGDTTSLRVRDAIGAILLPPAASSGGISATHHLLDSRDSDLKVMARDPASGLTLIWIPGAPAPELTPWTTQRLERSRYMIASDVSPQGPSLRPVFIGRLHPGTNPAWPGSLWLLPARADVRPGEFLFMTDGSLAGLVISHAGALALVPGETVLEAVDGLLAGKSSIGGWLGVAVQALPRALSSPMTGRGTGAAPGVIIAWVDPQGPAAGALSVMDIIEAAGGVSIASPEDWRVRVARLQPAESIVLRVRRGAEKIDVSLTAAARPALTDPSALGLTLRTVGRLGAEVVTVESGSSADRAGIREGDLITAVGEIRAPTAQQITRAFAAAPGDRPLLVAITHGEVHRVVAIEKVMSEK